MGAVVAAGAALAGSRLTRAGAAARAARAGVRLTRRFLSSARPLETFLVERYPGWSAPGVLSLSSSECEPMQLQALLALAEDETRQQWEALSLGYPAHNEGSRFLRDAISEQYDSIAPEQVNVCAPQEGIYLAMRALLSPGDHIVVTAPCYQSLYEVALHIGCDVSHWRPRLDGGEARFVVDDLATLLRPATRLVVANWPHNPTGALPSAAEATEVVRLADAAGAHLFVDEMYRGLEHAGPAAQLAACCDAYARGVSLGGVSKAHGLPGLRIGWLASRDAAFMARVARLKDYTSICPPAPSEVLALIALRAQPALLAANRARLARGKAALRQLVARHAAHLQWLEPRGGTFAYVRLAAGASAGAYGTALLARTRLMLVPSTLFHDGDERVRVTFGHDAMLERYQIWEDDLTRHGLRA